MIIVWILALIDVHTLAVLLFHNYMSVTYVMAGATLPILKGLFFFITSGDFFSFLDILSGFLMFFLLIGGLWSFVWWFLFIYLIYKITMSFLLA